MIEMLVESEVVDFLRSGTLECAYDFSASCVERMAPIFIALRGPVGGREEDLDIFVELLDRLWVSDSDDEYFARAVGRLEEFAEMRPGDVEVSSVIDTYCFYAVLAARHAALLRSEKNIEAALSCGHVCLTAMGQFDNNNPGSSFFCEEHEMQRLIFDVLERVNLDNIREGDRVVGQARVSALIGRLSGR
ncbi:hypothetical protein [Nocardiopsis flavescens]|uniref:hypothetical protein n=1 Tax=Nocardiopsis flavescens TaxID=758803 RepID=UPI00116136FC|nr:hypothetical protein [Nocardiopsis flavescens]